MYKNTVRFANKSILIETEFERVNFLVKLLLKDVILTDEMESRYVTEIVVEQGEGDTESWRILSKRNFESTFEEKYKDFSVNSDDELCFHLLDAVLYYIADATDDAHMIHAGCVSRGQSAVILPGASGAGKTTLMTWLVKHGYAYQSDEMVAVQKDLSLEAFKRSMQIKDHGYDVAAGIVGDDFEFSSANPLIVKGERFAILPWKLLNPEMAEADVNLKAIIYPNYQKGAGYHFEKLSPANAAMLMMSCHINARNLPEHGLREVSSFCRAIPSYRLTYSEFSQLEDDFVHRLDELLD